MDFIEQIFGISPDAGSGSLELLLLAIPLGGLLARSLLRKPFRGRRI